MINNPTKFRHHDFIPFKNHFSKPINPKIENPPIPPDYLILDEKNHHILNIYQFRKDRYTIKNLKDEFQFNIFSIKDLKILFPEYKIILP